MRCLQDAVVDVKVDAREYHATADNAPDDLRSEYVADGELQLSQWARDSIATALPTQILCRRDCAGLCPVCGKDLNRRAPHARGDGLRSSLGGARGVARGMSTLSPRARIVLIEHGRVALIRRVRDGHTYYLFPGGGVEAGETPEEAARREAVEELGVEVELGPLVHQESFGGTIFLYYDAWIVGGSFGTGSWPDHALLTARERERNGTHEPVWVPLEELPTLDVRPRALGALLTP